MTSPPDARRGLRSTPLQIASLAVGSVFLLIGVAGFIPGVTSGYHEMTFAGHHSGAMLFGYFAVSVLHNIVHLLFGVAGVWMWRTVRGARLYLLVGGAVYAVLWVYGMVIEPHTGANFVPVNDADNWLHLGLAVGMLGLGLMAGRSVATTPVERGESPNSLR